MAGHVRVQEVVQLRGELDARRAAADDTEVEELAPVRVGYCWLVGLLETCIYAHDNQDQIQMATIEGTYTRELALESYGHR